jgi:hypothetical protein
MGKSDFIAKPPRDIVSMPPFHFVGEIENNVKITEKKT